MIVIALLSVLISLSCSKKPTEPDIPDDQPIVAEETVVLPPATANSIVSITDNQFVFPSGTDSSIYQVGNVITAAPTTAAPYGLLRKVVSHNTQGNQVIVNTAPARLEDAFDQLDLNITQNMKTSDIESSQALSEGVVFQQDTKNPYNFNYQIDEDYNLGSNVILNVNGELNLTLGYELIAQISLIQGLHYIKAGSFISSNGELELNVNGSFTYERNVELYQHTFTPFTFMIGAVPIVVVPKAIIVLTIDANGQASVTTSVTASASLSAGVIYQKPSWSTYQERTLNFNYNPPVLTAAMDATVSAGPRFEINLYGIAGPFAYGRAWMNLNANISSTPWWTLRGGYFVDAGVRFNALGYVADYTAENIISHSTILAQAAQNQVATPTFNPVGGTYSTSQNVSISTSTPNATIRYTTDGSEPTSTSTVYSSPISVSSTTTIKAKGFRDGWTPSATASATYTIGTTPPPADFVFVQGGTFHNGTSNVTLSSFYIDKYEVTQASYQAVMGTNPSYFSGNPNRPVEQVSWFNAIEYCNRRSLQEGLTPCYSYSTYGTNPSNWPAGWNTSSSNHTNVSCNWSANGYRLPTEMEWMYAAKGGNQSQGYTYSGSNTIGNVAWYSSNSSSRTWDVGLKDPNELGTFDMSGNVWEWVWDIFGGYPSGSQNNPTGASSGYLRVLRGGSWSNDANVCTVSFRNSAYATDTDSGFGFRIVRVSP